MNTREMFEGQVILAPLTRGGNLPFRRLLVGFGARVTTSEMAVASKIGRHARGEMALLRHAEEERCFGVQLAGRNAETVAAAAVIAEEKGAAFVDLNLGCPIDAFCRKGMGAALMKKTSRAAGIIAAMSEAVSIPVTAKIRLGWDDDKPKYLTVGRALVDAGATAIAMHGRSRKQRYKRASDWNAIAELAAELSVPVIGNGDLLSWRDVEHRRATSGCAGLMIGRGALVKPWIFTEIARGEDILLGPEQRLEILKVYRDLALAHWGDDEHGRKRVTDFLFWHLDLYTRYRPVSSEAFGPDDHPLIQTRDLGTPVVEGQLALLYSSDEADRAALTQLLLDDADQHGVGDSDAASVSQRLSAIL